MRKKSGFIRDLRISKMPRTVKTSYEKLGEKPLKPTATAFCINIHNSTKHVICMHKTSKTREKGINIHDQLFTIHTPSGEHPQSEGDQISP